MKQITIKADPQNPNRMEDSDKERMALSLAEFGDLGGIVINKRTGLLIGGHQRVSVLGDSLEIEDLKKPEPDGTVGRGWITKDGLRYAVRVVDWDEAKAHAALLAANRFGRVGSLRPLPRQRHDDGRRRKPWAQSVRLRDLAELLRCHPTAHDRRIPRNQDTAR